MCTLMAKSFGRPGDEIFTNPKKVYRYMVRLNALWNLIILWKLKICEKLFFFQHFSFLFLSIKYKIYFFGVSLSSASISSVFLHIMQELANDISAWPIACDNNDFTAFCASQANSQFFGAFPNDLRKLTCFDSASGFNIPRILFDFIVPRSEINNKVWAIH